MAEKIPTHRLEGAFLGLALGDAYGRPFEFVHGEAVRHNKYILDRNSFMWTDDTHMALYLADAVIQMPQSKFNNNTFGHLVGSHFSLWFEDPLTPSTAPGNTCLAGVQNYRKFNDWTSSGVKDSDGSGAVMRICPLALAYSGEVLDQAAAVSATITHAHPNAIASAVAACRLLKHALIHGSLSAEIILEMAEKIQQEYPEAPTVYNALLCAVEVGSRQDLEWLDEKAIPAGDGGWRSPSALGLALATILRWGDSFESTIDKASRIDGDSDTVAALAGMFWGAMKGSLQLPESWLNLLPNRRDIERKVHQLQKPNLQEVLSVADQLRHLFDNGAEISNPNLQRNTVTVSLLKTQSANIPFLEKLANELGVAIIDEEEYLSIEMDRVLVPADIRRKQHNSNLPVANTLEHPPKDHPLSMRNATPSNKPNRTSVSHPIQVNQILSDIGPGKGIFGITFAPGKKARSMFGSPWERDLALDLDRLKALYKVDALISLVEEDELQELHIVDLVKEASSREIAVFRSPIVDGSIPSMIQAKHIAQFAVTLARAGQHVVFHCKGGLGRAGTLCAISLLHLGYSPQKAIDWVRQHRQGAIENHTQEAFIYNYFQQI